MVSLTVTQWPVGWKSEAPSTISALNRPPSWHVKTNVRLVFPCPMYWLHAGEMCQQMVEGASLFHPTRLLW